jgi:hypothetical protein
MSSGPRILLAIGITIVVLALLWQVLPWRPGRLPGDLSWGRGNVRVFVPCGTSILLSVLLTLAFWVVAKLGGR